VTPGAIANLYALGAAGIGLWVVSRYPSVGPRTLRTAGLMTAAAYCLLVPMGDLMKAVLAAAGAPVALLFVYLPLLTLVFWTAAHFARLLLASFAPSRR
jgi:hypothetical protein